MTDPDWRAELDDLLELDEGATRQARARRGRRFEGVLRGLLEDERLAPRTSYRPRGEEIDGSFVLNGRTMLVEAKWTGEPVPASTLYQFRGKLDGKLVGTIGVFISMGGYSQDAADALIAGKTLNILLVIREEIEAVHRGDLYFADMIEAKLRGATEQGTPFFPVLARPMRAPAVEPLRLIVVEGDSDMYLLSSLLRGAREKFNDVQFLIAFGRQNLPKVAEAFSANSNYDITDVLIVADSNGNEVQARDEILAASDGSLGRDSIVIMHPNLETLLGLDRRWMLDMLTEEGGIDNLDDDRLWRRAENTPDLQRLLRKLGATRGSGGRY
ncbi:restriction endonuclease [Actinomycetospora sp. NBC_00405]|uniref:restriction endonuclease n=1 Tax=Actinomycetospora sp. NBC_00405 TaxID=2975952 RepID=UPI002E244E01